MLWRRVLVPVLTEHKEVTVDLHDGRRRSDTMHTSTWGQCEVDLVDR